MLLGLEMTNEQAALILLGPELAGAEPPAAPPTPEVREAFRAGFLAVCQSLGTKNPLDLLTRVWSFNGVAAADLEHEAWAAFASRSGGQR